VSKHIVATTDELPPGSRKIVEIAGRSIGVFNVGGEYFALRNRCPHQGGPLCEGRLAGFVDSSGPGDIRYSRRGEILRCPWHAWEYDIRTGQSYFNPAVIRVRYFETSVNTGTEVAAENASTAATVARIEGDGIRTAGASDLRLGPYVAETYSVTLNRHYIVVEVDD
jgi:3-phenylpropionate/trans-cinnamate dioxygenase ferredoxin subunit